MKSNNEKYLGQRTVKFIKSLPDRLDELEKWRDDTGKEIENLQKSSFDLKKELAEFVFQIVSITMGLFAVLLAVLIGFSANWNFKDTGINYVIGLLGFLSILLVIWFILWLHHHFKRK
ncbi:MAG: hypothetical protein MUO82_09525 [Candidatus Thermoplasmatota archaeon]|nr:hypothetical protein [Candidatus Thermoplasmatota archaeon]